MAKRRKMVDTSTAEPDEEGMESRTQKRAADKDRQTRLEALGQQLTTLTPDALTTLELGENIEAEVRLLGTLGKGSALARQRRRVASLLRARDLDELERRAKETAGPTMQSRASTDRLERLRRELLEEGDAVLHRLFDQHPELDRHRLRQAVRAARRETAEGPAGRRFKVLFQVLRELGLGKIESQED